MGESVWEFYVHNLRTNSAVALQDTFPTFQGAKGRHTQTASAAADVGFLDYDTRWLNEATLGELGVSDTISRLENGAESL